MTLAPNFRTTIDCGCGCGAHGTPRTRAWANGTTCVQRKCRCARCLGSRNSTSGKRKPNKSRKVLGLVGANTTHEEHWGGPIRTEHKSGAQVGPIWTRYQAARNQSEAARPIGDIRPFAMVAHPKGTSEFLVIVSSDQLADFLEAYGGAL